MQRLGQHFLINRVVLEHIVGAINPQAGDTIIEIGPGHGELTDIIREKTRGFKLFLIEKDEKLAETLREKYRDDERVELLIGDARTLIPQLTTRPSFPRTHYRVVGNIPYYLTNFIIRTLLELEFPPREIIFTIQKEVAERIIAKPPHMNLLAVSVQYFGTPELLFTIPKTDFNPPPQIDSATIQITLRTSLPTREERESFFRLVKGGFSHPRKLLSKNISSAFDMPQKNIELALQEMELPPTSRAQNLSVSKWDELKKRLANMV